MDYYLLAIGWWNFVGSLMMLGFLYQPFGRMVLNDWTKIFTTEFYLDYWGKLWFIWAAGLNIFFGLINIYAVKWDVGEMKTFLITFDVFAYLFFVGLAIWGIKAGRCGQGIYTSFLIFGIWIIWGLVLLLL